MRTAYARLFSVQVEHDYYRAGHPGSDVSFRPAPETAATLRDYAFIVRPSGAGFSVYAEVRARTPPIELVRPVDPGGLRLAFTMSAVSPYLTTITDLPDARPGRQVWCFDNLHRRREGDRLLLGDDIAGTGRGPAVWLEAGSRLRHQFTPPVTSGRISCADRFGTQMFDVPVPQRDPPEPIAEFIVKEWDRLPPGRYTVADSTGRSRAVYRDHGLNGAGPLAVIEIFAWPGRLASGAQNPVPRPYRFLTGDTVTARTYTLRLEPRSTTWRYVVVSKHRRDDVDLSDLKIAGPPKFKRQIDGDQAVFTARSPQTLSESPAALTLTGLNGTPLALPSPTASTPIEAGATSSDLISTMHVYI